MYPANQPENLTLIPHSAWDCHLHGWIYSKTPCIQGAGVALEQNYTPEDLEPLLSEIGIKNAVIIQAVDPHEGGREEAERLINWVRKSNHLSSVVVSADLEAGTEVEEELKWISSHSEVSGIRIIKPQDFGRGIFSSPNFIEAVNLLPKYNLHLEWLMREKNIGQLEESIECFELIDPALFIMGNHLLKPVDIETGKPSIRWKQSLSKLAERKSFWMKLSALSGEAVTGTPDESFFPFYDYALECFGPDRLVFGSDFPVSALRGSYSDAMALHLSWIVSRGLQSIIPKLFRDNPLKFYDRKRIE